MLPWLAQAPVVGPGSAKVDHGRVERPAHEAGVLYAPLPERPEDAAFGDEILVRCQVHFFIDAKGGVERATTTGRRCVGPFKERSKQAAMNWRFSMVTDAHGAAVASAHTTEFTFRRLDRPVRPFEGAGVLQSRKPELPGLARWMSGLEVACTAIFHIDAQGSVEQTEVEGCAPVFADAVRAVAGDWRFSPWTDDSGVAVASLYPLTVTFRTPDPDSDKLAVDIPGLLSISIAPRALPPLPPPPPGVVHTDDPLAMKISSLANTDFPDGVMRGLKAYGVDQPRFRMVLLLTVDHRGKVQELTVLDGPPQLADYLRELYRPVRFEVDGLDRGDRLRFIFEQPLRVDLRP